METNEIAKGARYQEAEKELMKLIEEVGGIEEGDLKGLEEKIYDEHHWEGTGVWCGTRGHPGAGGVHRSPVWKGRLSWAEEGNSSSKDPSPIFATLSSTMVLLLCSQF